MDRFVHSKAISGNGTVLDDSIDEVDDVQPQTRANYSVPFFGVPCSSISHTEQELDQFCGEVFR